MADLVGKTGIGYMSRSRLAGKAIYFVTRAKILEEAASIGNQANCSRFCANLAIAITTAHTKSALAEEKNVWERKRQCRTAPSPATRGWEGGRGAKAEEKKSEERRQKANEISR